MIPHILTVLLRMHSFRKLMLLLCLGFLCASSHAQTFKIMTAGDSITEMGKYQDSMRTLFTNGGYSTTWVGTRGSAPNKHEGWSGKGLDHFNWSTAGGSTSVRDYMNANFGTSPAPTGTTNVVTLMLGINNMDHGLGVQGGINGFPNVAGDTLADGPKLADNSGHDSWITGQVSQLVDSILSHPANVKLVIAKIPPVGRGRDSLSANFAAAISRINRLNATYQTKYDGLSTALKDRVRLVDHNSIGVREYGNAPEYDWGTQTEQEGDWVHPRQNAGLWSEMGQSFYTAIIGLNAPTRAISGTVTLNSSGLNGVSVSTGSTTAITDTSGNYTLNLPDGPHTITPSREGYFFSPTTLSVTVSGANQTGKNFTATALPTYSVSGTVTLSGSALSGVLVSNGNGITATTDASGNYTVANIPQGSYTITPTKAGHVFNPVSLSGTISGNLTAQNFVGTLSPATYEGFNYSAGAGALANKSGGNNWNGAWDAATNDINATGLTYISSGTLTAAGGKAVIKPGASSFRSISSGTKPDGTYWLSFIAKSSTPAANSYGGLSLYDGSNEKLFVGQRSNASNWGVERSATNTFITSATGTGASTFLVVKIVLQAGNDLAYLWTNPSLSGTPADSSATAFSNITDFTFDRIRLETNMTAFEVDEIRIGQSYTEVAPTGTASTAPVIQNKPLSSATGTVGQALTYTISASGSPAPTFSVTTGTLPSGLALNSTSGAITGTPAAISSATVTISATSTQGTDTANLTFVITGALNPVFTGTASGSPAYVNDTSLTADKAYDGSITTFFAPAASGSFTQLDLGSILTGRVTTIRYYPRPDHPGRMDSGKFQGSALGSTWTDLHTITGTPAVQWNEVAVSNTTYFRYFRYYAPGNLADVAEIQFRGLTQSVNSSGLQSFRSSYNLPPDGSQDLATPANDGVRNVQKYAFNMIGTGTGQASALGTPNTKTLASNGNAGLPLLGRDSSGKLTITFVRRISTTSPGVSYAVEFSDAVTGWAVNASATEFPDPIDTTFERVTVTDSSSPMKRFVRVKVTSF